MKKAECVLLLMMMAAFTGCEWWYGAKEECEKVSSASALVLAGKCFQVDEPLIIGDGESIELGEGTEVRFGENGSIRVQSGGRLVSVGNGDRPVELVPSDDCWGGVVFEPGSSGTLEGTVVDGGGACACEAAGPCVTVAPTAEVTLHQVGVQNCGTAGIAGEPAIAEQVGCSGLGVCGSGADDCVLGGQGDDWCADQASMCWDDGQDPDERECEIGDRRCSEDRYVQSCVGGKWTSITDCSELTNGQTACRSYDGFPRCGLPGPSECLALPEQPGGSYIPGCGEEGCPEYREACKGNGQAESCEGELPVESCLHPNVLSGPAVFTGLGPRWIRVVIYNWGGLPDTTEGTVFATLSGGAQYQLRTWLPPSAAEKRNYCGSGLGFALPMPPPGEEYEVVFEVSTTMEAGPNVTAPIQIAAFKHRSNGEVYVWRRYSPDVFFARCDELEETRAELVEDNLGDWFSSEVCVDQDGRFVETSSRTPVDGFPDLSLYPGHRDPVLDGCDTWELSLEYLDE